MFAAGEDAMNNDDDVVSAKKMKRDSREICL
jgi:hypothetical protein